MVVSTVPVWFLASWVFLLVMFGLMLVVTILLVIMTPAKVFLQAKLKKIPVILILGRDRSASFKIGKPFGAIAVVKKVGPFILTENSSVLEQSSSVPMFFAFGEYAKTLPVWWPALLEYLKSKGVKLNRWSDYAALIKAASGVEDEDDEQ